MIKLLGVFLAIFLHTPTSLYAHTLAKRDHPPPSDTGEIRSDRLMNRGNLWLGDYLQNANEHSRLLSSLQDDDDSTEFGEWQHPGIPPSQQSRPQDSIPQVIQFQRENHEEHEEEDEEEGQHDAGRQEEYDEQSGEQSKEEQEDEYPEHFEEEHRKQEDEKYQKPEIHLFGPLEPQKRRNVEQFQREYSHTAQFKGHDFQNTPHNQPDAKLTDQNPWITRVELPPINFSYIHPERWSLDNPECSGRLQSPVNLDSDKLVGLDVPSSLIWTGYWNYPENLTIIDSGHSVELSGTWAKKTEPFISGGPLEGDYLFASLHFHWGRRNSVGSEHTINNNSYPMEMHMVHYKREYETVSGAQNHDDGLAVVAFLFEISETPNFGINFLADSLSKIQNKPGVRIPVKPYPLASLHFIFQEDYASYVGSLTTPPCREIVTWLVSSRPLTISSKQLESFRKISNKWPDKENHRPQQALNGRNLYYVAH